MNVINIYYVRVENGKNIAQYSSFEPPPAPGVVLDLSPAGTRGLFDVLTVKETPFVGNYKFITITVRPSSSWRLVQKALESETYYEVHPTDLMQSPTSSRLLQILDRSNFPGTAESRLLHFVVVFAILLYFRRVSERIRYFLGTR
jgi:hypothetical protein